MISCSGEQAIAVGAPPAGRPQRPRRAIVFRGAGIPVRGRGGLTAIAQGGGPGDGPDRPRVQFCDGP